jgi:hypothetical protein
MEDSEFKEKIERLIRNRRINGATSPSQQNLGGISKMNHQSNKKRIKMHRRKSG